LGQRWSYGFGGFKEILKKREWRKDEQVGRDNCAYQVDEENDEAGIA
jgi:hypothetical protein